MKKPKIDLNKIIRVKPKMVKESPDVGILFAMIIGFLLGMILITLVSCEALHGDSTIVITLDDDSMIEISGEELAIYGELTPMDD